MTVPLHSVTERDRSILIGPAGARPANASAARTMARGRVSPDAPHFRISSRDAHAGSLQTTTARSPFERGTRAVPAVLFPSEAGEVRLLNGDMVTPEEFDAPMKRIDARLKALSQGQALLTAQLAGIEGRPDRIESVPERWLIVGMALVVVLIIAEVGTPFLEALVVPR